jgi:hypothetical protein
MHSILFYANKVSYVVYKESSLLLALGLSERTDVI